MDETRSGPMVVACIRITDLRPQVDPLSGAIGRDRWGIGLSPGDAAALEHSFRIADAWSGHVVVVTVAPPSADAVLREAMALGAMVIRIRIGSDHELSDHAYVHDLVADERALAAVIVAALAPWGQPALVVCGDRSADRGTGALPAFLAHELGAAQALGLVALTSADEELTVVAERRLDGGWRERLVVQCPAVCSVEGAGVRLRRASLRATMTAQHAEILEVSAEIAGVGDAESGYPSSMTVGTVRPFRPRTRIQPAPASDDPRLRLLALTGALVAHDPPTVIGPIDAPGAADALMAFLLRHGYLDMPIATPAGDGSRADTKAPLSEGQA